MPLLSFAQPQQAAHTTAELALPRRTTNTDLMEKTRLIGMNLAELQDVAYRGGMPKFVGKQLAEWIYAKGATDFDEMVNISKKNKQWLAANFEIGRERPVKASKSADGTVKYLFAAGAGRAVESVYIPDHDRATLCVSSQVGCKMNCYFCATGKMGFKANLPASAIINQILSIPPRPEKGETPMNPLTNVVFMGMGEPLDNFSAVERVIEILTAPWNHRLDRRQTPAAQGAARPHSGACGRQRAYRRHPAARIHDAGTESISDLVGHEMPLRL